MKKDDVYEFMIKSVDKILGYKEWIKCIYLDGSMINPADQSLQKGYSVVVVVTPGFPKNDMNDLFNDIEDRAGVLGFYPSYAYQLSNTMNNDDVILYENKKGMS